MARLETRPKKPPEKHDCGRSEHQVPALRASKSGRWRALVLILVHALVALHVAHWMSTGETFSPLEPSEAMEFSKHDIVNAGFVFFGLTILSTLVLGRWFCGWACHLVALQDLCLWLLKKVGIRPRPLRSRLLAFVPALAALYMFAWPLLYRIYKGLQLGPVRVELTKTEFWETFPPWPVALATFAVCGFVTVYFLGAKGFCTYACPYGAIFGLADRFAVGRIRVTDACEGCGHCTATCTSNVIVHEEVRKFGMVVDQGCMKCLDCISVCPKEALYFGFGKAAKGLSKQSGQRSKAAVPWREELTLAGVFVAAFLIFRGLYGLIPFLFALGLASVLAFAYASFARMLRERSASFLGRSVKKDGHLTRAGWVFAVSMAAVTLLSLHSALIQWHTWRSSRVLADFHGRFGAFLDDAGQTLPSGERARLERGLASAGLARRFGLLPAQRDDAHLAQLALLAGPEADVEGRLRSLAAEAVEPAEAAAWRLDLARYLTARGRTEEAVGELDASLAASPSQTAFDRLARIHLAAGRLDARRLEKALDVLQRAVEVFPENPNLQFNRAFVLGLTGRAGEAEAGLRRVLELDPTHERARVGLQELTADGRRGAGGDGSPPD